MAGTIGADTATAVKNANGNGGAHDGGANGHGESASLALLRAIGEAGTAATRAAWRNRPRGTREAVMPSHLPTREWLARASFCLLAVVAVGLCILAALGLLASGEAAGLALPVVAVASLVIGFYLGGESSRRRAEG